jgi:hypothetical protein
MMSPEQQALMLELGAQFEELRRQLATSGDARQTQEIIHSARQTLHRWLDLMEQMRRARDAATRSRDNNWGPLTCRSCREVI